MQENGVEQQFKECYLQCLLCDKGILQHEQGVPKYPTRFQQLMTIIVNLMTGVTIVTLKKAGIKYFNKS